MAFPTGVFCRLGEWKCSDGRQCVGERQRCDGKTGMWNTIFLTLSGINALNFVFLRETRKKCIFYRPAGNTNLRLFLDLGTVNFLGGGVKL